MVIPFSVVVLWSYQTFVVVFFMGVLYSKVRGLSSGTFDYFVIPCSRLQVTQVTAWTS